MNYCPHLGLVDDRSVVHGTPHRKNRCYAVQPADAVDFGRQERLCLSAEHVQCPRYRPAEYVREPAPPPSLPKFATVEVEEFDYGPSFDDAPVGRVAPPGRSAQDASGSGGRSAQDAPFDDAPSFDDAPVGRVAPSGRSAQDALGRGKRSASSSFRQWLPLVVWGVLAIVVAAAVMVYLGDARAARRAAAASAPSSASQGAAPSTAPLQGSAQGAIPAQGAVAGTPSPAPSTMPLQGSAQGANAGGAASSGAAQNAVTPEPGAKTVALGAKEGEAGWWSGGDERGNHLGDSFLYAGFANEQPFIAAARIPLSGVARGAAIRAGEVRLTGLDAGRFDPNAGGTWSVQMLADATFPDLARTDFQALYNAPAAVSLFPTFFAADLGVGEVNVAVMDEAGRAWLEAQLIDGATAVIVRITGPAGGSDSVFAWDSGSGAKTVGEGPELVLDMGPAPTHTPPLPTEAVRVATDTPTPANVLTAMAYAQTATAAPPGTPAYRFVTPTASPANLATLQARALLGGFPPIAAHTATPVNEATAAWLNMLATAEAYLTGTPTPPPASAVTPVIITPTPAPQNIMTAAANALTATAESTAAIGTPTPWGFNVIVATVTPPRFVIVNTPPPENAATATIIAAYATAVTQLTGTFTPFPYDAVTATPSPAR